MKNGSGGINITLTGWFNRNTVMKDGVWKKRIYEKDKEGCDCRNNETMVGSHDCQW